ncbi:histone methylation DOT1 [Lentinula guzmanii]|uniref:Histone-lysine N-methyltransferase, H3 lysine-79 specific n=1 Tax=Lentinula guzmanii TaxID=2804957 RepID=A0AA38JAY7_9AGAR|nr:histone methylation DOT1 [Lentinula guzmanii]
MNRLFAQTPRLSQQSLFSPILEGSYGRCIKPYLNLLPASGNHVYGEFMPPMLDFIFKRAQLDTNSVFLDLGSGVGTAVAQAAFACQCFSYGIEIREPIAKLGDKMIHDIQVRCGLWGVPFGKVELELGDMCKSPRVIQLMGVADLVLINNKVFNAILMEQIKCLFHHLKKGSIVVSTQSFTLCSTTRRGTQTRHALNDPSLQFKTETLEYKPEWVSWGSKSGLFYWQTKM